MYEFTLEPYFNNKKVSVGFFVDVENAEEIKSLAVKHVEGNIEACIVQADIIVDVFQLLVATNKALHAEQHGKMRTKNVHSEILFNLSPSNKISSSFHLLGLDQNTKNVAVVCLSENNTENVKLIEKSIIGVQKPVTELQNKFNKNKVQEIYKLTDEEMCTMDNIINGVITRIAAKEIKI